jgi:short-subunit dehydrogenase
VSRADFRARYGPWALVAGSSEGLGAAFARELGRRGLDLLLLARRPEALAELAAELRREHGIRTRLLVADLGAHDIGERVAAELAQIELGLCVYNAAHAHIGPFVDEPLKSKETTLDVNCRGLLAVLDAVLPGLCAQRRGGVLLVSSLAGLQGSPWLATYAASKAFGRVLAEGLWQELRPQGVDVVAACVGAIDTPNYRRTEPLARVPTLDAAEVARQALDALGGGPVQVIGRLNRAAAVIFERFLPRRVAVAWMGRSTERLYGVAGRGR